MWWIGAGGGSTGTPSPTPTPAAVQGYRVSLGSMTNPAPSVPTSSDFNRITIDGKTFTIIPGGYATTSYYQQSNSTLKLIVGGKNRYRYSR